MTKILSAWNMVICGILLWSVHQKKCKELSIWQNVLITLSGLGSKNLGLDQDSEIFSMNLPSIFLLVNLSIWAWDLLSSTTSTLSLTSPRFFSGQQTSQPQTKGNNALECTWENLITPIAAPPHRKRIDSNLSHHRIIINIIIDNRPLYNHVINLIHFNYDVDMYTDVVIMILHIH